MGEMCASVMMPNTKRTALKCDLREDLALHQILAQRGMAPVDYDHGLNVAKQIGATKYLGRSLRGKVIHPLIRTECSAKHNRGVQEGLYEAARIAISGRAKGGGGPGVTEKLRRGDRDGKCVIL